MRKIAIIVQRYGEEVSGGGEFYARALAGHLKDIYDTTVLTTTSLEYLDWDQHYLAGESMADGVRVLRFQNKTGRNWQRFQELSDELCGAVRAGEKTDEKKDLEWADAEGPYCPELTAYVERHRDDYDAFLVITYIYYTAIRCLPIVPDKAIFVPTAHDDIWMRFSIFHAMFQMPRWFAFLTKGEQAFVRSFFKNEQIPGNVIGCGVDIPVEPIPARFRQKYEIESPYVAFVGRVDISKSCDEMIQFFREYKRRNFSDLKLVLIGKTSMDIPEDTDIICTGFVSEQDKFDAISGAVATIAPSKFESLCIALLESFACGIPALVNGACEILREHCITGECGLYYTNAEEFDGCLNYLVEHPQIRENMGENAKKYICDNYTWENVMERLGMMIEDIASHPREADSQGVDVDLQGDDADKSRNVLSDRQTRADVLVPDQNTEIEPAFSRDSVTVCFSSSDYFAPMCGVAVSSLVANTSPGRYYDIFIMITDMSVQNRNLLAGLTNGRPNISLRFIDVKEIVEAYQFSLASYYTQFTFYRLLIPKLMCRYEKVLYLDSDMVINHDIAELYDTDIRDHYLAATLDLTVMCWQKMDETSQMHQYLDSLDLLEPGTYMQGGVSLYNIAAFNQHFTTEYLLQKATERSYLTCDQDLINICCKGHIKFVSQKWNMVNMKDVHEDLYNRYLPQKYYNAYIEARLDPYIVHYGAQLLPCFEAGVDFYPLFWAYARQTPFYEQLLSILNAVTAEKIEKKLSAVKEEFEKTEDQIWSVLGKKRNKRNPFVALCDALFPRDSRRREWLKRIIYGKMKFQGGPAECSKEYLVQMSWTGEGSRTDEAITLMPGGMLYGPYIKLPPGDHHLILAIEFSEDASLEGCITAEAGQTMILRKQLRRGRNDLYFTLDRMARNIEFVVANNSSEKLILSGLQFL